MDIRSINNNNAYIQQSGKTQKTSKTEDVKAFDEVSSVQSNNAVNDKVSINSSQNEADFAFNLLQNAKRMSYQNLRVIKQKMDSGEYDKVEVQDKLTESITNDINYLDSVEQADALVDASAETDKTDFELTEDVKQKLLNSDEVLNNVSNRLLNDILKL